MPELPEVETVARDLARHLDGAIFTGARGDWPRTVASHPTAAELGGELAGRQVVAVGRRAKLVLIRLTGGRALTIHLKMTGQLFVVRADADADRHVHLALALDDGRELRFRDVRKFGRVGLWPVDESTGEVLDPEAGGALFVGLGPEPLDDRFSLRAFRARICGRRRRLKPLLLDQGFLAGIGNIYADEALWRARLHPLRTAATLRPADETRLYRAIRSVLAEAVERRGSSVDDYTAPDGDGSMQERLDVYQRTGEGCSRCGRPIRRIVVGQRATHYCSWCQRLPRTDRPGTAAVLGASRTSTRARGRRWVDLPGEGTLGLTREEAARAAARGRTERTRRAAATRRAQARGAAGGASERPLARAAAEPETSAEAPVGGEGG